MTNDTHTPETTTEPQPQAGAAPDTDNSQGEAPEPTGNGKWFVIAALVLLVIYPAARWALSSGTPGGGTPPPAGLQASARAYQAGKYEDAVTFAKEALAADPNSADAYNNLAVAYMALHRVDEAIEAAQNAVRIKPDYRLAKNNLDWFLSEKAKAALPPVSKEDAAKGAALLNQSLEAARTNRYDECVQAAQEAVKFDPGLARAFNNLGFCQGALKQWDAGIASVQEALRLEPGLQIARNNLNWMKGEQAKAAK